MPVREASFPRGWKGCGGDSSSGVGCGRRRAHSRFSVDRGGTDGQPLWDFSNGGRAASECRQAQGSSQFPVSGCWRIGDEECGRLCRADSFHAEWFL